MLQQFWMIARYLSVIVSIAVSSHLLQLPVQILVLALVGTCMLAPLVQAMVTTLVRVPFLAPHGPPEVSPAASPRVLRLAGAPGRPGTALARAPARVVAAFG